MKSLTLVLAAIILYLIGMIGIGIWSSRRNRSTDDFYLGGRKLGPLVTAMSAEASDMSSWLLLGLPGLAMLAGIAEPVWTAIGLAVGTYINWLIVAKRLRIYSHHIGAITVPEFISKRYDDKKNILGIIAAVVIIVFFIPYTASGFSACGKLFASVLNVDYLTAMIVCAVIITAYCVLGGFLAASTTDLVQSVVMTLALIVVIGYGESACSQATGTFGMDGILNSVKELPGFLSLTSSHNAATGTASPYGLLTIVSTLAWGLGYFGMPHILLRFMAIENPKKLKISRRIASVWVVISMGIAILIGVAGHSLVSSGVLANITDTETIIIEIAKAISKHGYLLAIVGGIILAGILAATMSTADSQLIAASSSITHDICTRFFGIKLSNKKSMLIARLSVVGIAAVAVLLAQDPESSVFRIVSFAWAGFGAAFGPVVLAALFWKRSNVWGALAGMITGGAMVFIWKFGIARLGGVFAIYELLPAFILGALVLVVVSLITGKPSKDIEKDFDIVKKECKN